VRSSPWLLQGYWFYRGVIIAVHRGSRASCVCTGAVPGRSGVAEGPCAALPPPRNCALVSLASRTGPRGELASRVGAVQNLDAHPLSNLTLYHVGTDVARTGRALRPRPPPPKWARALPRRRHTVFHCLITAIKGSHEHLAPPEPERLDGAVDHKVHEHEARPQRVEHVSAHLVCISISISIRKSRSRSRSLGAPRAPSNSPSTSHEPFPRQAPG
jgi:hypothetical protein